jgi:hypothetical protein
VAGRINWVVMSCDGFDGFDDLVRLFLEPGESSARKQKMIEMETTIRLCLPLVIYLALHHLNIQTTHTQRDKPHTP